MVDIIPIIGTLCQVFVTVGWRLDGVPRLLWNVARGGNSLA
jgi:hypothetical protein